MTGGKRRGAEVDGAQTGAKRQNEKSDTRTREKDQVSQAGAERLKFQESQKGNDWKRGEKIESDSQKENCHKSCHRNRKSGKVIIQQSVLTES